MAPNVMLKKHMSSRQLLARLLSLSILMTLLICSSLAKREYDLALKKWQELTVSDSSSNTASYYTTLVSKMVAGDTIGLNELTSQIKADEQLRTIEILSTDDISQSVLATCRTEGEQKYFAKVPTCFDFNGDELSIYHKLHSAGYTVGYLLKQIPIPRMGMLLSNVTLLNSLVILACCSFITIASYYFMRHYFVSPIHVMISSIKNNCSINEDLLEISELQNLASTLKKSLMETAEYQSRIKSVEFEAKLAHTAQQVAHDIRSPLAALETIVPSLAGLPEE